MGAFGPAVHISCNAVGPGSEEWGWSMFYLAATIVVVVSLVGVVLTLVTLPGAWLMLATAVVCNLWQPSMFSWWTLGIGAGLALLAELGELLASAIGAKKTGGGKSGAVGSVVGALIGAIVGTPFLPPIGTVAGAVLGAAGGALLAERGIASKSWKASAKVAGGAAAGRLVATVLKTGVAITVAGMLIVGAFKS